MTSVYPQQADKSFGKASKAKDPLGKDPLSSVAREEELRYMSEFVLVNVFSDIFESTYHQTSMKQALFDTLSISSLQNQLEYNFLDETTTEVKVLGKSKPNFYFNELNESMNENQMLKYPVNSNDCQSQVLAQVDGLPDLIDELLSNCLFDLLQETR